LSSHIYVKVKLVKDKGRASKVMETASITAGEIEFSTIPITGFLNVTDMILQH
jgi:hypothetical protein